MPCSHLPPTDLPDPLRVEDAHLTETVLLIARGIAADLAFDRLPILADALEDTGCDNFALLHHLRSTEPHRVECWALRRLLRTTLLLPGNVPITFAYCPPGTFLMGSQHPEANREWNEAERPVHRVRLTKAFHIGIYPITQAQWWAVMKTEPSKHKGDHRPVDQVNWYDTQAFCVKVSATTGKAIRLPTEAEWEYACRAGTTTEFYTGDVLTDQMANFDASRSWNGSPIGLWRRETTEVGTFPANPWGLFDMHGNINEWCSDRFEPSFYSRSPENDPECQDGDNERRVRRNGSWFSDAEFSRSAARCGISSEVSDSRFGFRVVFTA